MNKFLKNGIAVSLAAMPFVLLFNSVDLHFRWTLSAGMASTLIVPLSCHNKDFRAHAFPASVASLPSNQLLINIHAPAYNTANINSANVGKLGHLQILNVAKYKSLLPEVSETRWLRR